MQQSLQGRICIVTGANAGLGLQISHELGKRGATLYMVCRNKERGSLAAQAVRDASGNSNVHLAVRVAEDCTTLEHHVVTVTHLCHDA